MSARQNTRVKSHLAIRITFILAGVAASLFPAEPVKKESLIDYICRVLRFDPAVYRKLVAVRGGKAEQISGRRIVIADLTSRTVRTLDECGTCWSPIPVDANTIAYVKTDGVWVKSLAGDRARLAVKSEGIRALIGPAQDSKGAVLVVRHALEGACPYEVQVADLESGILRNADEAACIQAEDLIAIRSSGSVLDNQVLSTTPQGVAVVKIRVGQIGSQATSALLPWLDQKDDGIDRFDPVWLSREQVAFVERP